jgi:hypothetical protein
MRRFDAFWHLLADLLSAEGRVLFVDEPADQQHKETFVREDTVERRLTDGTTFHIVKTFIDPPALEHDLHRLGWTCTLRRTEADWPWIHREARRADRPAAGSDR